MTTSPADSTPIISGDPAFSPKLLLHEPDDIRMFVLREDQVDNLGSVGLLTDVSLAIATAMFGGLVSTVASLATAGAQMSAKVYATFFACSLAAAILFLVFVIFAVIGFRNRRRLTNNVKKQPLRGSNARPDLPIADTSRAQRLGKQWPSS